MIINSSRIICFYKKMSERSSNFTKFLKQKWEIKSHQKFLPCFIPYIAKSFPFFSPSPPLSLQLSSQRRKNFKTRRTRKSKRERERKKYEQTLSSSSLLPCLSHAHTSKKNTPKTLPYSPSLSSFCLARANASLSSKERKKWFLPSSCASSSSSPSSSLLSSCCFLNKRKIKPACASVCVWVEKNRISSYNRRFAATRTK